MTTELHKMDCYCFEATDGWSIRRWLLVTDERVKAVRFMEEFIRIRIKCGEKWTYQESNIMDGSFLNGKVIL